MQSLWLIIIVFFVMLSILPIVCKVNLSYDLFNNLGVISINVFFIRVLLLKLRIENGKLCLYSGKSKKTLNIKLSEAKKRFLKQFSVQIKEKIIIKDCITSSIIGVNDAMNTALLTGAFNSIVGGIYAGIKIKKKSSDLKIISNPEYNGHCLSFCICMRVIITIFDFIYGLLISFLIVKRSEKYEGI